MRRFLINSSIVSAFLIAVLAVSAAPTNFAGTWLLDPSKSQISQGPGGGGGGDAKVTWTITQDEKQLKVEIKREPEGQRGPQPPAVYNLDGSPATAEVTGRMTGKATRTAKWLDGGKSLELKSVTNAETQQGSFTSTSVEHWELAEGGKVLKVHRKTESQRGAREDSLVLNKQ